MLTYMILGNSLQSWIISILVLFLAFIFFKVLIGVLGKRCKSISEATINPYDDLICILLNKTNSLFIAVISLLIASKWLLLQPDMIKFINVLVVVSLWFQIGYWANHIIVYFIQTKKSESIDGREKTSLSAISTLSRFIIWSIVFILALDQIPGIEINALLTSLGIGGIAIGLALQNILGDLFASLSIAFDQPFVIGDFISVAEFSGTVEKIGLKSTRIRSIAGEELIFSNSDLLRSRIQNFKQMEKRRVNINLGVTYNTSIDNLKKIPSFLQSIVENQNDLKFDRANLSSMGDFSINFELIYWVNTPDYSTHMNLKEIVLLAVYEKFEANSIEIAFPTQSLIIEKNKN